MTRQTKIILGVVGAALVLCLGICVVGVLWVRVLGKNVASDLKPNPEKAAQVASQIIDFTPPPGFEPQTGTTILGYTFVVYSKGENSAETLMLLEMPVVQGLKEINDANIQQMKQSMEQQTGRRMTNVKVLETRDLTIRGKPALMILQEGNYGENTISIRQLMVFFQGKGGVAMLMASAPSSSWDQAAYDGMVKSLH